MLGLEVLTSTESCCHRPHLTLREVGLCPLAMCRGERIEHRFWRAAAKSLPQNSQTVNCGQILDDVRFLLALGYPWVDSLRHSILDMTRGPCPSKGPKVVVLTDVGEERTPLRYLCSQAVFQVLYVHYLI